MTVESVIIMPVVLFLVFTIIQVAAYFHARNVASEAADQGVSAARVENAPENAGRKAAMDVLNTSKSVTSASVTVTRDPQWVSVTVTGKAPFLVTGWGAMRIHQTARAPRERVTDPGAP